MASLFPLSSGVSPNCVAYDKRQLRSDDKHLKLTCTPSTLGGFDAGHSTSSGVHFEHQQLTHLCARIATSFTGANEERCCSACSRDQSIIVESVDIGDISQHWSSLPSIRQDSTHTLPRKRRTERNLLDVRQLIVARAFPLLGGTSGESHAASTPWHELTSLCK